MARLPYPLLCLSRSSCPKLRPDRERRRAGFTLIETALALGIVAFALVPLVALLPIGLQVSRNASDLTMSAQIAQRLSGVIAQDDYSDFDALAGRGQAPSTLENNFYYFDSEGQPLTVVTLGTPPAGALYTACIEMASASLNANVNPNPSTVVNSTTTATLIVQVANDPAHLWTDPTNLAPTNLQGRTVTIPIYFAGTGG